MVFCNIGTEVIDDNFNCVTILILIDGFLQFEYHDEIMMIDIVTILILIDGFLQ